ncbi:PREDICTED: disease resistance protein At4g27190-like [Ipomoea nil]|uniref:disease resistance protein At4g27190-like n=1 Tax=Ipomoea nil TaxID=35883 RepID=UPI000900ED16|nr:PREDICTED: disease resistance protein At4g27190-like [Ipomoea nil]
MEVVAAIVGSTLTEPFRLLFRSICAKIKNVFKNHSNYKDLERNMESLLKLKQLLEDDELQHHLPRIQVEEWLRRVESLSNEFSPVQSGIMANGDTTSPSAKHLMEAGREFENRTVGVNNPPPIPVEQIPVPSIEGQPTCMRNLSEMMNLLRNGEAKRIGVWGMGGIGKTTLIKNLNNELSKTENHQLFSIVIWVVVSQQKSLKAIQSQIAERLNMKIKTEESEHGVATRLHTRLEKEKSFLLILDDVWDEVNLDLVGIPRLENHTGGKLILTSRFLDVCRQMLTDTDFELSRLSQEEAWSLFSQHVGEEVMGDDQIKPWAEAVIRECDGLPLAIIVVGASMRRKRNIALWKDALDALRRSVPRRIQGVEEKVYNPLKWSYDSLEGEHLKPCFLFFCLFPEDYEVDVHTLVQYWLAEGGLLDELHTYEQLYDRCVTIVESLKDSCLLERGFVNPNSVKMHDVVRDVGIWIASSLEEDRCKSFIRAGVGETWISEQHLLNFCSGKVKRVSFMNNNIASLPNCEVQCVVVEASTLFLQGNKNLLEVPNSFLQGFRVLRILDLSGSKIKFLPASLLQLGELRALVLEGCNELSELPHLATTLGKLQVLDCSDTAIAKLPEEFERLTSLRQLSLSHTHKLQKICIEKISNLCNLEFLNMISSAARWGTRKTNEESIPFEELLCLDRLNAFYIVLEDIPHFTTGHVSWLGRINNFTVDVCPNRELRRQKSYPVVNSKEVSFYDIRFSGDDESVGWLLINAFSCKIDECKEVDLMLGNLVRNSFNLGPFAHLKDLSISNCCISVQPGQCVAQFDLLPNLEKLSFFDLGGLESLSDLSNLLGLHFTKLKYIRVCYCDQLENFLRTDDETLGKLEKVEQIDIESCMKLKQVFENASSDNFVPNLQSMHLILLPSLEAICEADLASWESLKVLEVKGCNMLRKLPLGIQNAESIEVIEGEQNWWDGLEWDNENSKIRLQSLFIDM